MEQIVVQTGSEPHGLRSRLAWVDVAKGLGIVLLVVLHVEAASDNAIGRPIVWVLKLFRMPMFFIVSGMLFSPRGHLDMAARKTRSLLVPYVSFMIAIWIALVLRYLLLGVHTPYVSLHGIKDMILGGERLRGEYGVFWFMTGLFFTQMLYNAIIRRWQDPLSRQVIASVGSVLLAGYALWFVAPKFATPLALGTVPFGAYGSSTWACGFSIRHGREVR
ncbi:MAG: hypothetical protein EOO77_29600 [Oxalobacteraceae bacterium]|nr:MAG: hypothetical protein EOO77_29600 [Oxalobacteraceae bacterium]